MEPTLACSLAHEASGTMRRKPRFHIHASCRFWWSADRGEMKFGQGQTRDLSSDAVCVISNVIPSAGALVMVEVDISAPQTHDYKPSSRLLLEGEGVVFRQRKDVGEFVIIM